MDNTENQKDVHEPSSKDAGKRAGWAAFVESDVVNFFKEYELEKLTIEDGNGNKAKLTLTRDEEIKVEYSSITIL